MKNLDYEAPEEQENEMQEAEDHAEETVTEQTAETDSEPQTETTGTKNDGYIPYGNISSEISTTLAYLHGVREDFLSNPDFNYNQDIIKKLELNDNCKIIRCLCTLRSSQ